MIQQNAFWTMRNGFRVLFSGIADGFSVIGQFVYSEKHKKVLIIFMEVKNSADSMAKA